LPLREGTSAADEEVGDGFEFRRKHAGSGTIDVDRWARPAAAERLSDHCPVVVEIQDRDVD
jgi:hypothetical protein